jgi:arginine utilization protein RocB
MKAGEKSYLIFERLKDTYNVSTDSLLRYILFNWMTTDKSLEVLMDYIEKEMGLDYEEEFDF